MKNEASSPNSLLGIHAVHGMAKRRRVGNDDEVGFLKTFSSFMKNSASMAIEHFESIRNHHSTTEVLATTGCFVFVLLVILIFFMKKSSNKKRVRIVEPVSRRNSSKCKTGKEDKQESDGCCYLTYETDSTGRLMLFYQRSEDTKQNRPKNAVGIWKPSKGRVIQDFKFETNGGRCELIRGIAGGDSNRQKYYEGWCQYLKIAKAKHGIVRKFPKSGGVEVDIYGFDGWESKSHPLKLDRRDIDISKFDAVAVVPKHKDFLQGVTTLSLSTFLEKGSISGASAYIKK